MAQQNQRVTYKRFVAVRYIRSLSENIVKILNNNAVNINVAHSTGNNFEPTPKYMNKFEKRFVKLQTHEAMKILHSLILAVKSYLDNNMEVIITYIWSYKI